MFSVHYCLYNTCRLVVRYKSYGHCNSRRFQKKIFLLYVFWLLICLSFVRMIELNTLL